MMSEFFILFITLIARYCTLCSLSKLFELFVYYRIGLLEPGGKSTRHD